MQLPTSLLSGQVELGPVFMGKPPALTPFVRLLDGVV